LSAAHAAHIFGGIAAASGSDIAAAPAFPLGSVYGRPQIYEQL
jgi:hypothetical protein